MKETKAKGMEGRKEKTQYRKEEKFQIATQSREHQIEGGDERWIKGNKKWSTLLKIFFYMYLFCGKGGKHATV